MRSWRQGGHRGTALAPQGKPMLAERVQATVTVIGCTSPCTGEVRLRSGSSHYYKVSLGNNNEGVGLISTTRPQRFVAVGLTPLGD